jgi:periplasmic protein TonB
MFEDFHAGHRRQQTTRLRRSLGFAVVIYCSAGAAIVSATNTAHVLVKETLTQIEFAPPPPKKPEPEPEAPAPEPPPVEAPKPKARAGTKRAALKPPVETPSEKPPESSGPLAEPVAAGPIDGVIGVEGGTGTAAKAAPVAAPPPPPPPPPPPARLIPAKELPNNPPPPYPRRALLDGIEGDVVVAFDVFPDGHVENPQIVKGPIDFHQAVLKAVLSWRFQPATLGGKPVKERRTKVITFRGED